MNGPITSVVFDLGGVLIDWDPRYLYRRLFRGDEKKVEKFLSEICTPEWNHKQDAGRLYAEAEAELIARFPDQAEYIRAWRKNFNETMRDEIPGSVALLEKLHRQKTSLYALTNWPAETFPIPRKRFGFMNRFDGIVVSGDEKIAKPDLRLFRILIDRYHLEPASSLFIDDKRVNCDAAAKLGFTAIHFTTPQLLEAELDRYNLLTSKGAPHVNFGPR